MEKREVLIKLFNAELESWKSSNNWYGIIDENVLDIMYKNEERYKYIILDMLDLKFDDDWEDYICEVIYHLAKYNETAEGYANSIEELVDEILGANL